MFPWVYEFQWSPSHVVFLGIFFSVVLIVATTVVTALLRSRSVVLQGKADAIRWHADFEDLPVLAKACRHELANRVTQRTCENAFDCRTCTTNRTLAPAAAPGPLKSTVQESILGFDMPMDRLYHRGHTWARREENGTYTIGFDDFAKRLIGEPESITLPPVGTRLHVNGTAWTARKANAEFRALEPIDGEVVETRGLGNEWYLRVRVDESPGLTRHLLRGEEIRPWLVREIERLQHLLSTDGLGVSLADGGELVPDIHKQYPEVDWDGVWGEMFLQA